MAGHTATTRALSRAPLRLFSLGRPGPVARALVTSLGGGLVDGDQIDLDVSLGPGASAFFTTQASTKVYRGKSGQRLACSVASGASLALAPDPVCCFAGASFAQQTAVDLADDTSSLLLVDAFTAGRVAHGASGERWAFDSLQSRLLLRRGGLLLLDESLCLDASAGPLAARMRRFEFVATVVAVGPAFAPHLSPSPAHGSPVPRRAPVVEATSALAPGACLHRIAASSIDQGISCLRERLAPLAAWLGDDPFRGKR